MRELELLVGKKKTKKLHCVDIVIGIVENKQHSNHLILNNDNDS